MTQLISSFSPPSVWGGYLAATAGLLVDFATLDTCLGFMIKLITIATGLIALWVQIRTLRRELSRGTGRITTKTD